MTPPPTHQCDYGLDFVPLYESGPHGVAHGSGVWVVSAVPQGGQQPSEKTEVEKGDSAMELPTRYPCLDYECLKVFSVH